MSNFLIDLVNNLTPPAACLLCGADSGPDAFCPECAAALPWLPACRCPICALPTLDGKACGNCLRAPPAFDSTCAVFLYRGSLMQLIPAAKFGGRWSILAALARLMAVPAGQAARPDLLIALPLHANRLRERGFNQSLEIARPLARHLQLPLESRLLARSRDTAHQTGLSGKARQRNLHKAFSAAANLDGAHIAVIDDVMTTGASLDAAARALKQAGARRVDAWVLARTP